MKRFFFFFFFFFYCITELMFAALRVIQRYDQKSFHFWSSSRMRLTEILQTARSDATCYDCINTIYLSWIIKCLFLRNREPLTCSNFRTSMIRNKWVQIPRISLIYSILFAQACLSVCLNTSDKYDITHFNCFQAMVYQEQLLLCIFINLIFLKR